MDRKQFIKTGLIGSTALTLPLSFWSRPKQKLNILILGGTNYVGPAIVREALKHGHNVTLFNRGQTNPDLFSDLELIKGNRYPDRGAGLSGLQNKRRWDAVIDTWSLEPGCVDTTARLLADRVSSYLYISSIATYQNFRKVNMTEEGPMIEAGSHTDSFDSELSYPVRKRASEQAVEHRYGNRGVVLRCTSILGYDAGKKDPTSQSAACYWGFRFLRDKPLLAPDDPNAVTQIIDVKDVAKFSIRSVENQLGGAYNLVGPEQPLSFLNYLETWKEVTRSKSEIVKVSPEFLQKNEVRPFSDIPSWIPLNEPEPGFFQISNKRALNQGLAFRSLSETLQDVLPSLKNYTLEAISAGMSTNRELELLKEWNKTSHQN